MFIFAINFLFLLNIVQSIIQTPEQIRQQNNGSSISDPNQKAIYKIGVLFPRADEDPGDSDLTNMVITSELCIELAEQNIIETNVLPDVDIQFIRYYSNSSNAGITSWTTIQMISDGVDAVIGDMSSVSSEASAGITGMFEIPQCSCASAAVSLSSEEIYPYFFRTTVNAVLYGYAYLQWIHNMGWKSFVLLYTNDAAGAQVMETMSNKARDDYGFTMERLSIFDFSENHLKGSIEYKLRQVQNFGVRVIALSETRPEKQLEVLAVARKMGMLEKGWVWIVMNNIGPIIRQNFTGTDLMDFDGLMLLNGIWNFTGEPSYDKLYQTWISTPIPSGYVNPEEWNTEGLSFNGPSAYSCAEVLAHGLDHALDYYGGGRAEGLKALKENTFNRTWMTPWHYNFNYSGPSGIMNFNRSGDLLGSYFDVSYLKDGKAIRYASMKLDNFTFYPGINITYLGGTYVKPPDVIGRHVVNSDIFHGYGLFVMITCVTGFMFCILMFVLIFFFSHLKPIMVASPFFCYLQIIGLAMIYAGIILCLGKPTPAKCVLLQLFFAIGFSLAVGSMVAKNYRIYRIFQNVFTVRTTRLKSYYLVRVVAIFGIVAVLPLVVWYAIYPIEVVEYDLSRTTFCWICTYPTANYGNWETLTIAEIITIVWCFSLTVISVFLAFKTRNISSKWSETSQISYVSYNTGIAALIGIPGFFLSMSEYKVAFYLKISSVLFAVSFSLVVLYFPKFILIIHVILKENTKLSLYRMSEGSEVELTKPSYSSSLEENLNLNLVAKNLFDFTVQAHEGVLPVKKMARLDFFSIWELRHVILVPAKHFFVLSDKSRKNATLHSYTDCEIVPSPEPNHHSFRVRTDVGLIFLFQVSDRTSLERWVGWFKGSSIDMNNGKRKESSKDSSVARDELSLQPKIQSATFGIGHSEAVNSSVAQPSIAAHSSFYTQDSFTTSRQLRDTSQSALQNTFNTSNLDQIGNGNSFGVLKSDWQRYP